MKYGLRIATEKDASLLFSWVNDEDVRKNSFSTHEITWEEHEEWFRKILLDKKARQYIFTYNGVDVGQIRFTIKGLCAEISYSIASKYRCMGYAKQMVACLIREVKENFPEIHYLAAQVKPDNIASRRVFTDLGYTEKCSVFELSMEGADISQAAEAAETREGGVILLTNNENALALYDWLLDKKVPVTLFSGKISKEQVLLRRPDLIVSFNYAKIIKSDVVSLMPERIINIHISLLPWNRGSSPNVWSFVDDTPKGVTMHLVDEGLDTGAVLLQEELFFDAERETFETTYAQLTKAAIDLFTRNWEKIKDNSLIAYEQTGQGTCHTKKQLDELRVAHPFAYSDKISDVLRRMKN